MAILNVAKEAITPINLQEITNENRAGLIKRWNAAQKSIEDAMLHYELSRSEAEKLANLTYERVEMLAGMGLSLFRLNFDDRLFDLVLRADSSQELARLSVL